jgi:hypothetical protein
LHTTPPQGTIGKMLDQEAMQIARDRLTAESAKRHYFFHAELQRAQSELATKGSGRSGALIQAVADVCAKEIEDLGDQLWEMVRDLVRETKDKASFAKRIGKKSANVSAYLSGAKKPGKKTILSGLRHAFEWEVISLVEVRKIESHKKVVPAGVYALYERPHCALRIFVFGPDYRAGNLRVPDQEINQVMMPFGCSGCSPDLLHQYT